MSARPDSLYIWLLVLLPLAPRVLTPFVYSPSDSRVAPDGDLLDLAGIWAAVVVGTVTLAILDRRALQRAGLERPFHWRWALFSLVNLGLVYVLGRAIVAKGTGSGKWAAVAVSAALFGTWLMAITIFVIGVSSIATLLYAASHGG